VLRLHRDIAFHVKFILENEESSKKFIEKTYGNKSFSSRNLALNSVFDVFINDAADDLGA
jgi:hypothetical protein